MGQMMPVPPAAISRVLATFNREQLAGFVSVAIDLMDLADGDPDAEHDPLNEGEPAFRPEDLRLANEHPGTDPDHDAETGAWVERVDQSKGIRSDFIPWTLGNTEDAEEDDPQGEVTDDDPAFTPHDLAVANRSGSGPGCSISDPGGDHASEDEPLGYGEWKGFEGPGCPISDPGGTALGWNE